VERSIIESKEIFENSKVPDVLARYEAPCPELFLKTCEELANKHFGIPKLRDLQADVLKSVFKYPAVIATLPTGAGKTLLYVLPSLVWQQGLVLVISPLISLMRDQARRMKEANIPCLIFTSDQNEAERRDSYLTLMRGEARLLFVAPERLVLPSFARALSRVKVSMAVVDEAHCVVSWGPFFRPEYSELSQLFAKIKPEKILALTATASHASRQIIKSGVFPEGIEVKEIVSSPLGSNIFLQVERAFTEDEKWLQLMKVLKSKPFKKAIVYFQKRQLCETSALALKKEKIQAFGYHAGMTREQRMSVEQYLHASKQSVVVCATQAFGMGVDISDVDIVVVYGFPGNIEEYFQMIGRAGRKGEAARTILLWSGADPKRRYFQFQASFPEGEVLRESVSQCSKLLPGLGARRFVTDRELIAALKLDKETAFKKLPGIVGGMRMLGGLESVPFGQELFSLRLAPHQSIEKLLGALPQGVTRRAFLLQALASLAEEGFRSQEGGEYIFSIDALKEEAGLSWEKCLEIMHYYTNSKSFSFQIIDSQEAREGYVLKGSLPSLMSNFHKYHKLRSIFMESLRQLEVLAQSQTCRLASSEGFFGARSVMGARRQSFACMQCDLCISRQSKRKRDNLFSEFASRAINQP
jgi:ATP-dependent DNA helicase RecQ